MMKTMYCVDPHDTVNTVFLFYEINTVGKLVVKEEYKELSCSVCGKINEMEALDKGFLQAVSIRYRRPYILCAEDIQLVDDRARTIFEYILPGHLKYYSIPSTKYFVAIAVNRVVASESDAGYYMERKCKQCGRYRVAIWGKSPPTISCNEPFVSIQLENRLSMFECWLIDEDRARAFESVSSQLTGITITPKSVFEQAI